MADLKWKEAIAIDCSTLKPTDLNSAACREALALFDSNIVRAIGVAIVPVFTAIAADAFATAINARLRKHVEQGKLPTESETREIAKTTFVHAANLMGKTHDDKGATQNVLVMVMEWACNTMAEPDIQDSFEG